MKPATVYAITHDPTGSRYVGSTTKGFFFRVQQHVADLRAEAHTSKKLQALWLKTPITDWSFKVLEILENGKHRNRLLAEKEWLDKLAPDLRLNDNVRIQTYDRYAEIRRRIKRGEKYKDIAAATGVSIGLISQIKYSKRYLGF